MLTEKFFEVLKYEGVVSLITWNEQEANVTNTWNSYLQVTKDEKILVPVAGMHSIEADIKLGSNLKITLGAREVMGRDNYQGTGFKLLGTGKFITKGENFDYMLAKYPFIRSVLEITIQDLKQLL
ncbi:MAG: pyridoxamine 5'-phosphate oxidase family protein [Mycoplasmatales bacterium]